MKVLVNGGLNLSSLDGWWAEAYAPELGWALDDEGDERDAERLYCLLEREIVPCFYDRDHQGIPRAWLRRIRTSMAQLTPRFSGNRMVREYFERVYIPAADAFHRRSREGARLAHELARWRQALTDHWREIRFGTLLARRVEGGLEFRVQVYLGELGSEQVRVELFAEPERGAEQPTRVPMTPLAELPGAAGGFLYGATVQTDRPAEHFTPRVVPYHEDAMVPGEVAFVTWYR